MWWVARSVRVAAGVGEAEAVEVSIVDDGGGGRAAWGGVRQAGGGEEGDDGLRIAAVGRGDGGGGGHGGVVRGDRRLRWEKLAIGPGSGHACVQVGDQPAL